MTEFEARLSECLEAMREGRWDVDECLRRYPQHADALRPYLLAAAAVAGAYNVEPREEFARTARERFLVASGQRLREAYDVEPAPSFFAAARVRFLMAAHKMKRSERRSAPRVTTLIERHFRALAGAAAVMVLFLSFSAYTVASANSALPGDWQYPVKLQTERVRLALAFGDGAKRHVKLDIAEERAREIERMHRRGRIIGPGVLDRLVEQTKPLVSDAGASWDTGDLARLQAVSEYEKTALQQAQPSLDAEAQDKLAAAVQVTLQGVTVSNELLLQRDDRPPAVLTPPLPLGALAATSTPTETATPTGTETGAASQTPEASTTPGASPTAGAPSTVTPSGDITINPTPEKVRGAVSWIRLSAGRISTLIPSPADGWFIAGIDTTDGPAAAPPLVRAQNADGTSLITLNTRTGDMYWFIARGGRFDEVQMRMQRADGQVYVADRDFLRAVYGDDAEIPLFVLENLEVTSPAATATPAAANTATVVP